jgi:type I restriction enzyme, S subunit
MVGEVQLGQVGEIIMGQSPPGETYNEHGDGLPFFQGVADFNYRHPTPRVFCTAPSRIALPGDILLSVRAPIGRVNIADRTCAIGRGLAIIRPKAQKDGRYLEFVLRMLEPTWHLIEGGGSVFGNATRRDLETLCIPWHENACERHAIAHILGTLDDKIELNRRMSETLEAMARALFKAWFVDFEPARAKMQGRWRRGQSLPGFPAHLYDLFPDRLVDSELGEIPEGWRVVRLGDLISFEKGRKPPVSYPLPCKGCLPVVLIENFNGIVSSYALPKGMTIAQEKDVLMVMDGASSGRVETGHYGIVGSTLAKITLREGSGVGTHFLYYALKLLEPEIREHLTGTSIPHADKNWISAQMVCFPNKGELLFYFEEIVGQIRERIRALRGESRTLAALRDALLPKLIRGEIRVKDAERFLREKVA